MRQTPGTEHSNVSSRLPTRSAKPFSTTVGAAHHPAEASHTIEPVQRVVHGAGAIEAGRVRGEAADLEPRRGAAEADRLVTGLQQRVCPGRDAAR